MQNQIEIKISATINEDGSMETRIVCPPDINVGKLLLVIKSAQNTIEQALQEYLSKKTVQTSSRDFKIHERPLRANEIKRVLESTTLKDLYMTANEEPLKGLFTKTINK